MNDGSNSNNHSQQGSVQKRVRDAWTRYMESDHDLLALADTFLGDYPHMVHLILNAAVPQMQDLLLNTADAQYLSHQWQRWRTRSRTQPLRLKEIILHNASFSNEEAMHAIVDFMLESQTRQLYLTEMAEVGTGLSFIRVCDRLAHLERLRLICFDFLVGAKGRALGELLRSPVCRFTDLELNYCALDSVACMEIAEGLKDRPVGLRKFKVENGPGRGAGVAEFRMLVDGLCNSLSAVSLKEVTFSNLRLTHESSTGTAFASLDHILKLCHGLEILELIWCDAFDNMESDNLEYLAFARTLSGHKSLKHLDIRDYQITDAHAAPLDCQITDARAALLFRALEGEACSLKTLVVRSGRGRVGRSLVASLPSWKSVEKLSVKIDWNLPDVVHAFEQNTSLIDIDDEEGNDWPESIQSTLRRNKTIKKTLRKLLANRSNLTAMNWPFCIERLFGESEDMTPVFLFVKATVEPIMEGLLKSRGKKRESAY